MTGWLHDDREGAGTRPLRVLLAHDDKIERYGLARALEAGGIEVVGEAQTPEQIAPLVQRTRPDLLLLGAAFGDAPTIVASVGARRPEQLVLLVGGAGERKLIGAALAAGAAGFLTSDAEPADIPALLRGVASGAFCALPPEPAGAEADEHAHLTPRELAVLSGAARGLSNAAIGRELWLTGHTVKTHLHRIYSKLGVANRTEATRYALEHQLVGGEVSV